MRRVARRARPGRARSTRRRRLVRRRISGIRVRPEGIVKEKIIIQKPLLNDSSSSGYHNIHWFTGEVTDDPMNTGFNFASVPYNS